jgi:hypothetical protein
MIVPTEALARLEQRYATEAYATWTYVDALAWLTALWSHAQRLNPDFGRDWLDAVEADRVLARVLNGVPEPT